ncbi:hypothetical protein D3C73_724280 [compost metagenome]
MFTVTGGGAQYLAQPTHADDFINTGQTGSFTHLTMTLFGLCTQLGHIANDHHAITRHFCQHLRCCRHGADVGVIAVIEQQLSLRQGDREQTPWHCLKLLQACTHGGQRSANRHRQCCCRQRIGHVMAARQWQLNRHRAERAVQGEVSHAPFHLDIAGKEIH